MTTGMAFRHTLNKLACTKLPKSTPTRCLSTSLYLSKRFNLFSKEAEKHAGHSTLLADKPDLFEMLVDDVKPEKWDEYLKHKSEMMNQLKNNTEHNAELMASWKFIAGDVNYRAMHLFRYPEGWEDIDKTFASMKRNSVYDEAQRFERTLITSQNTEYMRGFSFWPSPDKREGKNIYDVRSYQLKPGSMYDWSNYWARGIRCRQSVRSNIPYAGFFCQLGQLHTIYHIWCYTDLQDRKQCREGTWKEDEWNDIVSHTVPLIRTMKTRILEPLPYSPTQ